MRNKEIEYYAKFCEAMYKRHDATRIIQTVAKGSFRITHQDTYHIVCEFDSKVVVVFRGTQVNDTYDLIADASLLFGLRDAYRFSHADTVMKRIFASTKKRIEITGHSLGGTICSWLAEKYPTKIALASVYNEGNADIHWNCKNLHNVKAYFIDGDFLSQLGQRKYCNDKKRILRPKKSLSLHTIRQFY